MIAITFEDIASIMTSRKVVELEMFEYKARVENIEREMSFKQRREQQLSALKESALKGST